MRKWILTLFLFLFLSLIFKFQQSVATFPNFPTKKASKNKLIKKERKKEKGKMENKIR